MFVDELIPIRLNAYLFEDVIICDRVCKNQKIELALNFANMYIAVVALAECLERISRISAYKCLFLFTDSLIAKRLILYPHYALSNSSMYESVIRPMLKNLNLQPQIFVKMLRSAYAKLNYTQLVDPRLRLKCKRTRMKKIQNCLQESLSWNYNDDKQDPKSKVLYLE